MAQRPPTAPDYADPADLAYVAPLVARDGLTVLFGAVCDTPAPEPLGCTDATVPFATVKDVVDPHNWYPDLYDHGSPPSLLGTFDNPLDRTPRELRAVQQRLVQPFGNFGNSALTHTAAPDAAWFRGSDGQPRYERSLLAFVAAQEARTAARDQGMVTFNDRWKVAAGRPITARRPGGTADRDTAVYATVSTPVFGDAMTGVRAR